jgi:hypothetical protein
MSISRKIPRRNPEPAPDSAIRGRRCVAVTMAAIAAIATIAAIVAGAYLPAGAEPESGAAVRAMAGAPDEPPSSEPSVAVAPPVERETLPESRPAAPANESPAAIADEVAEYVAAVRAGQRALLPLVKWNFEKHAGTPTKVLEHPVLNPKGVRLEGDEIEALDALIERWSDEVRKVERALATERLKRVYDLYREGALAPARRDADGGVRKPSSPDPEVEVAICGAGAEVFEFRASWGDDPDYDHARLQVFQVKHDAVTSLTDFIAAHDH